MDGRAAASRRSVRRLALVGVAFAALFALRTWVWPWGVPDADDARDLAEQVVEDLRFAEPGDEAPEPGLRVIPEPGGHPALGRVLSAGRPR